VTNASSKLTFNTLRNDWASSIVIRPSEFGSIADENFNLNSSPLKIKPKLILINLNFSNFLFLFLNYLNNFHNSTDTEREKNCDKHSTKWLDSQSYSTVVRYIPRSSMNCWSNWTRVPIFQSILRKSFSSFSKSFLSFIFPLFKFSLLE